MELAILAIQVATLGIVKKLHLVLLCLFIQLYWNAKLSSVGPCNKMQQPRKPNEKPSA